MHELMHSAVHWHGGAVFPLKPAALKALRLFSAEERGAGLSHAVLTAALVPYDDADPRYDREPDEPVDPEPQRLVGACPVFAIAARLRVLTRARYPFCLLQASPSARRSWRGRSTRRRFSLKRSSIGPPRTP